MDATERLAALVAGELDADERATLEADLARDPELRATLASILRADGQLELMTPPRAPAGFEDRLDTAVTAELGRLLGPVSDDAVASVVGPEADPGARSAGDETVVPMRMSSRPRRRTAVTSARRTQALVGVAAASVLLIGGGVYLTQLTSSGDDEAGEVMAMDADVEADAGADDAVVQLEAFGPDGPVVVADGRELDEAAMDELGSAEALLDVRDRSLDTEAGRDTAMAYRSALGAPITTPGVTAEADPAPEREEATEEAAEEADLDRPDATDEPDDAETDEQAAAGDGVVPELTTRDGVTLDEEASRDVARCLAGLLASDPDAIPVYTELATFEGFEVVVFGLVARDPATGAFDRTEVWALDRSDCSERHYAAR